MSFLQSYERLEQAFASGHNTQVATLGDVFLPNDRMPDLTVPIGLKVERSADLLVPTKAGELIVAVTARVTQIDYEVCAGIVGPEHFAVRTYMPRPEMNSRQIVTWEEDNANGPVSHESRVFATLTKDFMKAADQEHEEYQALMAAGADKGADTLQPDSLSSHMLTKISSLDARTQQVEEGIPPEVDPWPIIGDHFDTLGVIASAYPQFGHFNTLFRAPESFCQQTSEQFQRYTAWLLEG